MDNAIFAMILLLLLIVAVKGDWDEKIPESNLREPANHIIP